MHNKNSVSDRYKSKWCCSNYNKSYQHSTNDNCEKKKNYVLIIIQKLIQTHLVFGEIIDGNETYCCSVEDHLVMGLIYSIP